MHRTSTLVLLLLASAVAAEETWDREAALAYLDGRAELWVKRSRTRQQLETACISCHTAMPYLLTRASASSMPEPAAELLADVETRVSSWSDVDVWYDTDDGDEKPAQSWGTESVLNALVLTLRDRSAGGALSESARTAHAHMWARQSDDGAWPWLHFGLAPWEADGSEYWGAALAAVAAMSASETLPPPAQGSAKLRGYLRSGLSGDLSPHNRLSLVWAASTWDGLLSPVEKERLVTHVLDWQQPDGGFRLTDLAPWPSEDGTPAVATSDGYATAFATFVLQQSDVASAERAVARGVTWLEQNQNEDGRWETRSQNMDRSRQEAFRRLLMSDAATAFALLALTPEAAAPKPSEP